MKRSKSEAGRLGGISTGKIRKAQREERIREYNESPSRCSWCNTPLSYEKRMNKYCSHSCATQKNNQGVCRHGRPRKDLKCIHCGRQLVNTQRKYCSIGCQTDHRFEKNITRWLTGEDDGVRAGGLSVASWIRRWLHEKQEGKCLICGLDEWMGKPMPLVLDHVDGNSMNSRPDNVRLVCGNCDMQLPTYKSKNRGNGRHARRQRRNEGKSF